MVIFDTIPGYSESKKKLKKSFDQGRVSHAQIFSGPDGTPGLTMALGYIQLLFCESDNKPCGECASCKQISNLSHPDLHFSFPFVSTASSSDNCDNFMALWRDFLKKHSIFLSAQWNDHLETKNKQPQIYTAEGQRIIKALSLKSYSGKYKVLLLWQPELLNNHAANKLLKFIEEPDPDTIIILISHNLENVLPTIISRCQVLNIGILSEKEVGDYLVNHGASKQDAQLLSMFSEGNLGLALSIQNNDNQIKDNAQMFLSWLRVCFKGNPAEVLSSSEEMARYNRDHLKRLLIDFQKFIKRAFTYNQATDSSKLVIDLSKISPFITTNNIENIYNEFENGIRDVSRNGNPKIILYDMSLKMHEQLHNYKG